ncbi:MAG: DUF4251 domain-containing protein [Sediminibacterium sp.]
MLNHVLKTAVFVAAMTIQGWGAGNAQQTRQERQQAKAASVKKAIQDRRFTFTAQSALPMSGPLRQLTPDYDLRVSGDSVVAYLPYFGRAYAAPVNGSDGGIKFISTQFSYTSTGRKKGGWDIMIRPKDAPDVQQLFLTVLGDGTASLQVTSTNRQPISFNGYVTGKK